MLRWFRRRDSNPDRWLQRPPSCRLDDDGSTPLTQSGRSGRSRTFIFLVNSEAHCLYATDRKKAPDLRPEALLQNVLKKVRLHGDTLTRFDRDPFDKITSCSQMLHIETGYSQITSYLSTTNCALRIDHSLRLTYRSLITTYLSITKMAVPERIELSHSARQADIMATRSWNLTGASGGDRTHWLSRVPVYDGAIPSRRRCKMAEETGVEPACARISELTGFQDQRPTVEHLFHFGGE